MSVPTGSIGLERRILRGVPAIAGALALLLAVPAASAGEAASVQISASGLYALGLAPDATAIRLRVVGPGGELLADARNQGAAIAWSLPSGAPDGLYRYDVYVVVGGSGGEKAPGEESEAGGAMLRETGKFEVRGGVIEPPPVEEEELGAAPSPLAARLARALLDWLAPPAYAADLVASSTFPWIDFTDTNGASGGGPSRAAQLETFVPDTSDANRVSIEFEGRSDLNEIIDIDTDLDGDQSLTVDLNGDIGLANDAVFIDRSAQFVGIGTITPVEDLHISSGSPGARLEGSFSTWDLDGGDDLTFRLVSEPDFNNFTGPVLTLEDDVGPGSKAAVGIFESNPDATLHVRSPGDDGSAKVLVEETNATTTLREMFELRNNGGVAFAFQDTSSNLSWAFTQNIGNFVINDRRASGLKITATNSRQFIIRNKGTSTNTLTLSSGGNLTIAGSYLTASSRELKRELREVDGVEVLRRVAELPVLEWQYKGDPESLRHMGPMAEDFRAAFRLGRDGKTLSPSDAAGVALAAVQGLERMVREKQARIDSLEGRIAGLEQELGERVARLERQLAVIGAAEGTAGADLARLELR